MCFYIQKIIRSLFFFLFTFKNPFSNPLIPTPLQTSAIKKNKCNDRRIAKRVAFTIMHFKNDMKNLPQTEWIELRQKKKRRREEKKGEKNSSRATTTTKRWNGRKTRSEMKTVNWDFRWWCFSIVYTVMHRSGRNRWEGKKTAKETRTITV